MAWGLAVVLAEDLPGTVGTGIGVGIFGLLLGLFTLAMRAMLQTGERSDKRYTDEINRLTTEKDKQLAEKDRQLADLREERDRYFRLYLEAIGRPLPPTEGVAE